MVNADRIEELLEQISADEKYQESVFEAGGVYFIIGNCTLWEIPADSGDSPKGGWCPEIVYGPEPDEKACLKEMMEKLEFDSTFFSGCWEECWGCENEIIMEYFEEQEGGLADVFKQMVEMIESGNTIFETMEEFMEAVRCYDLEGGRMYYVWEDMFIDFHDNIADVGEPRGTYEDWEDERWIEILENIDSYVVS